MIRIDFHAHSNYSYDGENSVRELVEAAKKRGLNGIAVCDHNTIAKKRERFRNFLVIYGQEVSTSKGHMAVFGTNKKFEKEIDPIELVEKASEENAVTIATHPFAVRKHSLWWNVWNAKPTTVEYVNGSDVVSNLFTRFYFERGTGGSDAHSAFELGTGFTLLECDLKEESVLECVRRGKMQAVWAPSLSVYPRIVYRGMKRIISKLLKTRK